MKSKTKTFSKDWKSQLEKSGKFFEQEIAALVSESGFGYVVPNYAFVDIEKGVSREMDIFAISGRRIGRKWNFVFPTLLISVSNKPIVCFTRSEYMSSYTTGQVQYSGFPSKVSLKSGELELFEFLKLDKIHHYYKSKIISSQFWTPKEKRETQGDYFYKELILPLIKAVVAEKKEHVKDWHFDPKGEPINLQFYYPIIVVNQLWECNFKNGKTVYSKPDWIPFLFHTASRGYSGDYLIDICTKKGLKKLLKDIDVETEKIIKVIAKERKIMERSALDEAKAKEKAEKEEVPF